VNPATAALFLLPAAMAMLLATAPTRFAHADPSEPTIDRPLGDPAQEAQARALMREIRCVVCQSQSIDESDAEIAAELRNIVREQIAAGRSAQQIRDYLTARYGDFVLLDPPFKSETAVLWLGPFVLAALALAAVIAALLRRRSFAKPGSDPDRAFTPPDLTSAERDRVRQLLVDGDVAGGASRPGNSLS
jgi:cytochrome c-type biogenesis protein CcmH